jgi:nucleoside-diphosphate-sugar epimerase
LYISNVEDLERDYPNGFKMFYGDICDIDFISSVFDSERPTHICHLAARAGVRPSIIDPYIYVHSNVEGTTRLLDLSRKHNITNFVYASSSSVYGSSSAEILTEEDVVEQPVSPYAATKKACELIAYTFHHLYGLNTTGLRFFTVYGPRGRPDMAPFKFIDRIFNGNEIQQFGDGSTSRDYTYIDDIVDGVVRSIDRPLGYQVFNLGNGRPFLLRDFIQLVETNVGKKAIIRELPEQPGDVKRTCACIDKASQMLGYSPKIAFEDGIARTVAWYKQAHAEGVFNDPVVETTVSVGTEEEPIHAPVRIKDRLHRTVSDLEQSSFVEKADQPMNARVGRYTSTISHAFNEAYIRKYTQGGSCITGSASNSPQSSLATSPKSLSFMNGGAGITVSPKTSAKYVGYDQGLGSDPEPRSRTSSNASVGLSLDSIVSVSVPSKTNPSASAVAHPLLEKPNPAASLVAFH